MEGVFRGTMEVTLRLLRSNKDTLLSVLEPFLRDPTVAWTRQGRAQQQQGGSSRGGSMAAGNPSFQERENSDAKDALAKIAGRLNGVYNIIHPAADKIRRESNARGKTIVANRGLGATREEEALPLSVEGQVQRLIEEAVMEENLAQMFIGSVLIPLIPHSAFFCFPLLSSFFP